MRVNTNCQNKADGGRLGWWHGASGLTDWNGGRVMRLPCRHMSPLSSSASEPPRWHQPSRMDGPRRPATDAPRDICLFCIGTALHLSVRFAMAPMVDADESQIRGTASEPRPPPKGNTHERGVRVSVLNSLPTRFRVPKRRDNHQGSRGEDQHPLAKTFAYWFTTTYLATTYLLQPDPALPPPSQERRGTDRETRLITALFSPHPWMLWGKGAFVRRVVIRSVAIEVVVSYVAYRRRRNINKETTP
ncbi:hypothetical protein LX36DRAFT_303849 [Colletotrichum falcatum]|nr:hypothetical protein LX36DRAFT_303849 [Colletotrichum falcatum]